MSASPKYVVMESGRRISKQVHDSKAVAEAEKAARVKVLQESGGQADSVVVQQLLLG
jgi:hypothetical protein